MVSGKQDDHLTVIHHLEEIPAFANEDEEHAFWATHELAPELWESAEPLEPDELPAPRSVTRPVAIRFDEHTLARIKTLARRRHKGYQTLLKEFVTERLYEEEKREGLLT
ncbi:MAG TPA: CopG family antitoxin [Chloroflexota bacterium]|nr:CopG family antitoxin [Chloroflexota bacterium]